MKDSPPNVTDSAPSERPSMNRRTLLRVGAAGSMAVATLPLGCGGPDGPKLSTGPIVFGNVSSLPVGALETIPGAAGFMGRDDAGLYAMSAICTHQGCRIPTPPPPGIAVRALTCDCHGSQYDKNGAVLRGPAPDPLQHYKVDLAADGTITIQGDVLVGAGARTAVT